LIDNSNRNQSGVLFEFFAGKFSIPGFPKYIILKTYAYTVISICGCRISNLLHGIAVRSYKEKSPVGNKEELSLK